MAKFYLCVSIITDFTASIFTKTSISELHYVQILYTKFYTNRSSSWSVIFRKYFTPI